MKCDVCVPEKTASIVINKIGICSDCMKFFENLAKINNRNVYSEMDYQTKYINSIKAG